MKKATRTLLLKKLDCACLEADRARMPRAVQIEAAAILAGWVAWWLDSPMTYSLDPSSPAEAE